MLVSELYQAVVETLDSSALFFEFDFRQYPEERRFFSSDNVFQFFDLRIKIVFEEHNLGVL